PGCKASSPRPRSACQPGPAALVTRTNGRSTGPSRLITAGPICADHPATPVWSTASESPTVSTTGSPLTCAETDTDSGDGCTTMWTVCTETVRTPLVSVAACCPAGRLSTRTRT